MLELVFPKINGTRSGFLAKKILEVKRLRHEARAV